MTYEQLKLFKPSDFKHRCGVHCTTLLARLRVVVEHVHRKLKVFQILSSRYRDRCKRFGLRFNLIAAILNFELASAS